MLLLAGKGGVVRPVLKALRGMSRGEEVLRLAAAALGVRVGGGVGLRCGSRLLRGEETREECGSRLLRGEETREEAGVGAGGIAEVTVWIGEAGGMRGADSDSMLACVAQPEKAEGSDKEEGLAGAVGGLLGRLARDASGMEGAVQRLRTAAMRLRKVRMAAEAPAENGGIASRSAVSAPPAGAVDLDSELREQVRKT
jgi:hypothetical protein